MLSLHVTARKQRRPLRVDMELAPSPAHAHCCSDRFLVCRIYVLEAGCHGRLYWAVAGVVR